MVDGVPCGKLFSTFQRLRSHVSRAHDKTVFFACTANAVRWCLACKRVYSSRASALAHIRRAIRQGKCTGTGTRFDTTPEPIALHSCPVCTHLCFEGWSQNEIRMHLLLHFPSCLVQESDVSEQLVFDDVVDLAACQ